MWTALIKMFNTMTWKKSQEFGSTKVRLDYTCKIKEIIDPMAAPCLT